MRRALRAYLGEDDRVNAGNGSVNADSGAASGDVPLDDIIAERVDAIIADRLDGSFTRREPQDVNVNITLDGDSAGVSHETGDERKTAAPERENASDESPNACKQCGEDLSPSAVYCSNCGEKASHRVFCECGDELRSDCDSAPVAAAGPPQPTSSETRKRPQKIRNA